MSTYGFLLSEGVHTGNLTFVSQELGSSVTVPVTVTISNAEAYEKFLRRNENLSALIAERRLKFIQILKNIAKIKIAKAI